MAKYQVIKFHRMAPMRAERTISWEATFASTSPEATVCATPLIWVAPSVLKRPAIKIAMRHDSLG